MKILVSTENQQNHSVNKNETKLIRLFSLLILNIQGIRWMVRQTEMEGSGDHLEHVRLKN